MIDVLTKFNDSDNQSNSIHQLDKNTIILSIAGGYTIIDSSDLYKVLEYKWFCDRDGYATTFYQQDNKFKSLRLHQLLLPSPSPDLSVDHLNHVRLDNRKSNLKLIPVRENRRKHSPSSQDIIYRDDDLLLKKMQ